MAVTNVTPPVITGYARQGYTLVTSNGTWTSDDPLSFTYQWLRCDSAGANCNDIVGATSSSYLISGADVGFRLRSEVTATENAPGPPPGALLRFTPPGYPNYTGYTTINIANNGSNSFLNLNDSTDYILVLDDYVAPEGPIVIGGRNVVCIGGRITTTGVTGQVYNVGLASWPRGNAQHYFEGIRIRPSPSINGGSNLHDGIALRHNSTWPVGSGAKSTFQNMLVGPCSIKIGTSDSQGHADVLQLQSNPGFAGQARFDRFTGLADYNGIMLSNFTIGQLELHRWNIRSFDVNPSYSFHLGFYQGVPTAPISFDDVWISPGPGISFGASMYPGTSGRHQQPTDSVSAGSISTDPVGQYIAWGPASGLTGVVYNGIPPGGDFVEEADVGIGYVSPGYL